MAVINILPTGTFQGDDARLQRWLNVSRRNFITYGVAQSLPKVSPLTYVLMKRSRSMPFGGAWGVSPVISTNYVQPQYVYGDADTFTINDTPVEVVNANYHPALMLQTVRLTYKELASYDNPNNLVDLLAKKVENATRSIFTEMCERTATDDGSPTTSFKPYGIGDIVDNGTLCTDLAQIDRATNLWWNSPIYNYETLNPDNPPLFRGVQRAIVKYLAEFGNAWGKPTVGFTSYDAFQKIAESFQAIEQYKIGDINNIASGRSYEVVGITIQGIPIYPDPYIQTYSVNGKNYSDIYFLNLDYLELVFADPFVFYMDEWVRETVNGRLSYMTVILTSWNLITIHPQAHFKLVKVPS